MIYTTLNKIRAHSPCRSGWEKLLKSLNKTLADDEPVSLLHIVESNGLDDALWCCRTLPEYNKQWRLFAVWCARQLQHLMTDTRSINAIDVAERHANGLTSDDELSAAREAAWKAAREAAREAAWAAARAAAWAAARAAAWAAAREAAWAAARAAAREAAREAAWAAAWAAQKTEFIRVITEN